MSGQETRLQERLKSSKKIFLAEIKPPKGGNPEHLQNIYDKYSGKVLALGVSDNRDEIGMSSLAAACILQEKGIEPIMHIVTRDRNRIALLSDCLGAKALGIDNILCTSGTHQTLGTCHAAKGVFDIDTIHLLHTLHHLSEDCSVINEEKIPEVKPFFLGAVADPYADPIEMQTMRLEKKISAGAGFIITKPVFDVARFKAWWEYISQKDIHNKVHIIAGIHLLSDAEKAEKYSLRRPSPCLPDTFMNRLSSQKDREAQRKEGVAIAVETINELSTLSGIKGFEIISDGDDESAITVIEKSGT